MASSLAPKIQTFKADGAIAKGKAVKLGSDFKHVAVCSAASDNMMGIAQSASSAAEDLIEVAVTGGGAKGLCQTSVATGALLTSHSDGALKAAASGERYVAVAKQDGVAGDLIDCDVALGIH